MTDLVLRGKELQGHAVPSVLLQYISVYVLRCLFRLYTSVGTNQRACLGYNTCV